MAQHAEEDGLQQAAVWRGKLATLGMTLDEGLGVIVSLSPGVEGGNSGLADVEVFGGHEGVKTVLEGLWWKFPNSRNLNSNRLDFLLSETDDSGVAVIFAGGAEQDAAAALEAPEMAGEEHSVC